MEDQLELADEDVGRTWNAEVQTLKASCISSLQSSHVCARTRGLCSQSSLIAPTFFEAGSLTELTDCARLAAQ